MSQTAVKYVGQAALSPPHILQDPLPPNEKVLRNL